jgi:redox-sensing transcriptional repressor
VTERLSKGVGARLFRYAAVLAQAKKTGRARITSQELAAYTGVNATQIRRDLSSFGTFGRRGIGYSVDRLLGELGEILFMERKHRVALVGAGRLGQAIANSPIFAEQGVTIATIFDRDPAKVGQQFGGVSVSDYAGLGDVILGQEIVVAVLAIPAASAQQVAGDLAEAGVKIIFNYSEALLDLPDGVSVLSSNPATELVAALSLGIG